MFMFIKQLQLSLIHVAVAMTLVPINSTLNRVMIKEMALSATLVAVLASLPYIFSPLQIFIGSYSDRHPLLGWRRTPYIAAGLVLCAAGVMLAPLVVFLMPQNVLLGLALSLVVFAAWGMGYNIASVAYISLATELSGEKGRSATVSMMWFLMIVGIIITAATLSSLLTPYSPQTLQQAFQYVGLAALVLGAIGMIGLEPRHQKKEETIQRASWQQMVATVLSAPQARHFFFYLIVLLSAILGQDVLLEPFAGTAFNMPVATTTRITSIWGGCVLLAILAAGLLERLLSKHKVAQVSAWVTLLGFALIGLSGLVLKTSVFYSGVVLMGAGTGLATVSNLSLMLDMTTSQVGLFIGAWGMAEALARLVGSVTGGAVRDLVAGISSNPSLGYVLVFFLQAGMLLLAWFMLRRVNVRLFRQQTERLTLVERTALINET